APKDSYRVCIRRGPPCVNPSCWQTGKYLATPIGMHGYQPGPPSRWISGQSNAPARTQPSMLKFGCKILQKTFSLKTTTMPTCDICTILPTVVSLRSVSAGCGYANVKPIHQGGFSKTVPSLCISRWRRPGLLLCKNMTPYILQKLQVGVLVIGI